LDKTIPYR